MAIGYSFDGLAKATVKKSGDSLTGSLTFTANNTGLAFLPSGANDKGGIRYNLQGGNINAGELEFYTADDAAEPFFFRSYDSATNYGSSSFDWLKIDNSGMTSYKGYRHKEVHNYGSSVYLGESVNNMPSLVILGPRHKEGLEFDAKEGITGRVTYSRGGDSASNITGFVELNVSSAHQNSNAEIVFRNGACANASSTKIVEVTHEGVDCYALWKSATLPLRVHVQGIIWGDQYPIFIPDSTAYAMIDVQTGESMYHIYNKPKASDVGAVPLTGDVNVTGWLGVEKISILPVGSTDSIGYFGRGADDLVIFNEASGKYIQMKDDGKLSYSNSEIYHEGHKPTASEVGALPISGGTLTGSLVLPQGRTLKIPGDTDNSDNDPTVYISNEAGYAMLWRFPHPTLEYAGKQGEFIGINSASQPVFRMDNGEGTGTYSDHPIYHRGAKPTATDVGAIPITGGTATGNVYVDRGTGTEPQLGVVRGDRKIYLYDSASTAGLYCSDTSLGNVHLIHRRDSDGAVVVGHSSKNSYVCNPFSASAQSSAGDSLTRRDFVTAEDAKKLSLTGGTMTGTLVIDKTSQQIQLKNTTDGQTYSLESVSGKFRIYDLTGAKVCFDINNAGIYQTAAQSTANNSLTRKDYVDAEANKRLALSGGTMTGNLTISNGAPWIKFNDTETSKAFYLVADGANIRLDENSTAGPNIWSYIAGVLSLTGPRAAGAQGTNAADLTRKDYVDGQIATRAPDGYGLGEYARTVTDVNTGLRTAGGFYNGSAVANAPNADWHYYINVCHANSAGYNGVIAMNFSGTKVYHKTIEAGADKGWGTFFTTKNTPTAAQGNSDIVASSHSQVGTYAFLALDIESGQDVGPGETYPGSSLKYSSAAGSGSMGGIPTGTWKCVGWIHTGSDNSHDDATLWIRVA